MPYMQKVIQVGLTQSVFDLGEKIFLKHVVTQQPVLLFTDGHKSHLNLDVIDLCWTNDIILFCLPPHTTHALQPLDVAVFKSLKDNY